jgi:hypothetical protein
MLGFDPGTSASLEMSSSGAGEAVGVGVGVGSGEAAGCEVPLDWLTVMLMFAESEPKELVAATMKVKGPPDVGVPDSTPVVGLSVTPGGSEPLVTE